MRLAAALQRRRRGLVAGLARATSLARWVLGRLRPGAEQDAEADLYFLRPAGLAAAAAAPSIRPILLLNLMLRRSGLRLRAAPSVVLKSPPAGAAIPQIASTRLPGAGGSAAAAPLAPASLGTLTRHRAITVIRDRFLAGASAPTRSPKHTQARADLTQAVVAAPVGSPSRQDAAPAGLGSATPRAGGLAVPTAEGRPPPLATTRLDLTRLAHPANETTYGGGRPEVAGTADAGASPRAEPSPAAPLREPGRPALALAARPQRGARPSRPIGGPRPSAGALRRAPLAAAGAPLAIARRAAQRPSGNASEAGPAPRLVALQPQAAGFESVVRRALPPALEHRSPERPSAPATATMATAAGATSVAAVTRPGGPLAARLTQLGLASQDARALAAAASQAAAAARGAQDLDPAAVRKALARIPTADMGPLADKLFEHIQRQVRRQDERRGLR